MPTDCQSEPRYASCACVPRNAHLRQLDGLPQRGLSLFDFMHLMQKARDGVLGENLAVVCCLLLCSTRRKEARAYDSRL
jgi:hypothetical protein